MSMSGVEIGALGILVTTMVWYFKNQTKRQAKREDMFDKERTKRQDKIDKDQKEERNYYRGIVNKELKKNAVLNYKGIALQKEQIKESKAHTRQSEKFSEKIVESLGVVCDRLNGGNKIKKVKDRLKEKIV